MMMMMIIIIITISTSYNTLGTNYTLVFYEIRDDAEETVEQRAYSTTRPNQMAA
jgi:hypothetical protein